MTPEEFLYERIGEAEKKLEGTVDMHTMRPIFESLRAVIALHSQWPVLVQDVPKFETQLDPNDPHQMAARVTQNIMWMTQREYEKRFRQTAPTAPLIKTMLEYHRYHPDMQEEWLS